MGNRINDPVSTGSTPTDDKNLKPKKLFGSDVMKGADPFVSSGQNPEYKVQDFDSYYKYLGQGSGIIKAPIETWDNERALRQSNGEQFRNAVVRTALNVLPETLKQGSRMLDFTFDFESDNALAQAMTDLQDKVNQNFSIYRENPEQSMNFGDFAYWMEQGSDLVQSVAAFALSGYGIGAALGTISKGIGTIGQSVARAINAGRKAEALGTAVAEGANASKLGTVVTDFIKSVGTERNALGLTQTFLMNKAEGVGVALDTYQSVLESKRQELKNKQKESNLTDAQIEETAKKEASDAASYAYNLNNVNILLNLSSSFAFVKPSIAGFRQQLEKQGIKHTLADLTKETAQEGLEETVNYVAQKRAESGDYKGTASERIANLMKEGIKDATSEEGLESALWGAIGGFAQTGFTKAGSYAKIKKNEAYDIAYRKHLSRLTNTKPSMEIDEIKAEAKKLAEQEAGSADKRVSINDIKAYKNEVLMKERQAIEDKFGIKEGEDNIKTTQINESSDLLFNLEEQAKLDDQITEAYRAGDYELVEDLSKNKFDYQVLRAMETGTLNTLEDSLKAVDNLSPKEAVDLGLAEDEKDLSYKSKVKKGLQTIKDFESFAVANNKYINSNTVNELDRHIYRLSEKEKTLQQKIQPTINEMLQEKRNKFFSNYTNSVFVPYVSNDYYKKTHEERQEEFKALTSSQKAVVTKKTKELEDGIVLTADDFKGNSELLNDFEFLNNVSQIKENYKEQRKDLTSPKTQALLEKIETEAKLQARQEFEREVEDKKLRHQKETKTEAKAENIAKTIVNEKNTLSTEESEGTKQRSESVKVPKVEAVETEEGVEIKISNKSETEKGADLSSVVSKQIDKIQKFLNKIKIDESDSAIIDTPLYYLQRYNDILTGDLKNITSDKIDATIEDLKTAKTALPTTSIPKNKRAEFSELIAETITIGNLVKDTYATIPNLVNQVEALGEISTEDVEAFAEDEAEDEVEDNNEDSGYVDVDNQFEKVRNLDKARLTINSLLDLMEKFNALGVPINSFNDLEKQLYKVADKESLIKLRPQLVTVWNSLNDIQNTPELKVSPDLYRETDVIDSREYNENKFTEQQWTSQDEETITELADNLMSATNEIAVNPLDALNTSGTGLKSTSPFNLAYLAKPYDIVENFEGGRVIRQKVDLDDSINDTVDQRLLDRDTFPVGSTLYYSPLRDKESYTYYDKSTKERVVYTRMGDEVEKRRYPIYEDGNEGNALISRHPAVTHLPIFISDKSNSRNPKRVKGLFLHLPGWITTDNIAGTEEQVELKKQVLIDLRQNIINNKGKLLSAKVINVSQGIVLTDNTVKAVKDVSQKQTPVITVVDKSGNMPILRSNRERREVISNEDILKSPKLKNGMPLMVVQNGKQRIAIPITRKKIANLPNGKNIKNTIKKVLEIYITPDNKLSSEQKQLKNTFTKQLGIDFNKKESVSDYINTFIYTSQFKTNDLPAFNEYVKNPLNKELIGSSVFKFSYFPDTKQTLFVFGNYGEDVKIIDKKNGLDNLSNLLNSLDTVLDNSYINVNIERTVLKKPIAVVNDDNVVEFIGDNYKDFLSQNLFTKTAPITLIDNNGKEKEIFTIQHTIELGEPEVKQKVVKKVIEENKPVEIIETIETETEEDQDVEDAMDSFDIDAFVEDEADEDGEELNTTEEAFSEENTDNVSLLDSYNFVKGINSNLLNAVYKNITNLLSRRAFNKEVTSINAAFDEVYKEASDYVNGKFTDDYNTVMGSNKDEVIKSKVQEQYNSAVSQLETLKTQKQAIINKIQDTITRQGLYRPLSNKEIIQYNNELKEKKRLEQERLEKEATKNKQLIDDVTINPDYESNEVIDSDETFLIQNTETEDYLNYDRDGIYTDSFSTLNEQIKAFFNDIRQMEFKKGKLQLKKNAFGLTEYVEPSETYRKVQEILASTPNNTFVKPTFDNFVKLLESHTDKQPYLNDVVTKLKSEASKPFRNAFVKGMHKQYNNTHLVLIGVDGRTKVVSSDSSNYVRLSKDKWEGIFNLNSNNFIIELDNENPVKMLNPALVEEITHNYRYGVLAQLEFKNVNTFDLVNNIKSIYESIGIFAPPKFYEDLMNNKINSNGFTMTATAFAKSPMFRYTIGSIVGNQELGLNPIGNLFFEDLYHNSGFNNLAHLLATYDTNLFSPSSKDIKNNTIYNYSEFKNLIDAFYKNKYDNDWLNLVNQDPYRNLGVFDNDKQYKTWLEQLVTVDNNGSLTLNDESLFSKTFEYLTFNGASFTDEKGTQRIAVEELSTLGLQKTQFNAFFNGNVSKVNNRNIRTGWLPFHTMSDKKVPIMFKAPVNTFSVSILLPDLYKQLQTQALNGNQSAIEEVEQIRGQKELIFNTLLKPEINRITALTDDVINNTNIAGYTKSNLKFFNVPLLNFINFDYIDGLEENGADTEGKLRKKLGLEKGENLFIFDENTGNPKTINTTVLDKDTVQEFLLDRTLDFLATKVREVIADFESKDLIYRDQNNNKLFTESSRIDEKTILENYTKTDGEAFSKSLTSVIITEAGSENKLRADQPIADYVINTMLGYANMQQMLIGDPIQFADNKQSSKILKSIQETQKQLIALETSKDLKENIDSAKADLQNKLTNQIADYNKTWGLKDIDATFINQGKRLAGDNASGEIILAKESKPNFRLLIVDDFETSSDFIDQYVEIFKKAGFNDETAKKYAESYGNINTADAQELTTLREYTDILESLNLITQEDANEINKKDKEGTLSMKEFGQILTSMKLVYSNNFMRDGVNSRLYIKSSSFPLAKTFTKGLPIDELREFMENPDNNIDRVAFKSAIKVGNTKTNPQIFKNDGSLDLNKINIKDHVISVPREGHKKQLNVPYDEDKAKISDGTQKSKLIFLNLMDTDGFVSPITGKKIKGRELYEQYMDTFNTYYKLKYFKLKDRIISNGKIDFPKLHSLLVEEAISRGYSENDMKFLELSADKQSFFYPLWLSSNQVKIEALLNSIVDNNVRKRKRKGISKVLVSDSILDIRNAQNSNLILLDKNRTEPLRPMRIDEQTGEVLPAEVIISFPFKDNYGRALNINDYITDGQIDTNKIPNELLESIGFRIPTQGLNSMSYMKIVGFLPASVDNVVFAPKDFVIQMGSDFDVDKLYMDLNNSIYNSTTGELRLVNVNDYENRKLIKRYFDTKREIDKLYQAQTLSKNDPSQKNIYKKRFDLIREKENMLTALAGGRTKDELLEEYNEGKNDLNEKFLENQIMAFHRNILRNPHSDIQAQRIQPIDNSEMEKIKDVIIPIVYPNELNNNWSALSPLYQINKYKGARAGKAGVSTFSSDSVMNATMQTVKKPINFTTVDEKGRKHTVTYNLFGKKSLPLNSAKTVDGKTYKSDVIQALQSIAVDNEKLQMMDKLNINSKTFDFIRAAVQLGYTSEDIFYMINHPIIKAFVEAQDNNTTFQEPSSEGTNPPIFKDIMSTLTHEDMIDAINKGTYEPNSLDNAAILFTFKELTNRGKQLKQIQSLLSLDSTGLGSNLFYSIEKQEAINNLRSNKYISNASRLLGDFRPKFDNTTLGETLLAKRNESKENQKEYEEELRRNKKENQKDGYVTDANNDWFKPTSIAGSVSWFGLNFNNTLWSSILPYKTRTIGSITDTIATLERNKNVDLFADNLKNIALKLRLNTLKSFNSKTVRKDSIVEASSALISKVKQQALKEYKSFLFSNIGKIDNTTAYDLREKFYKDNYLADMVKTVQLNKEFPNNKFIQKLGFETIQKGDKSMFNIVYNAASKESFDEDYMVSDIISLLENNNSFKYRGEDIQVKDFAKMLIQHQLVNGGLQEAVQFIKHIPVPYLHNIGLYNLMRTDSFSNDVESKFIEQYLQHHPESVYSRGLEADIKSGNNSVFSYDKKSGIITKKSDTEDFKTTTRTPTIFDYVSIKENGNYTLFKVSPFNKNKYLRIPLLGKPKIKEYDVSREGTLKSVFEDDGTYYPGLNTDTYEASLDKGYQIQEVLAEFDKLFELGRKDENNPDAILKICE